MKPRVDLRARMERAVQMLFEAYVDYCKKNDFSDEGESTFVFDEALGKPCTDAEIAALEAFLKVTLPPSYRAFLSLYSHWDSMPGLGGAVLLGPKEHLSEHVKTTLAWKSSMFAEFEEHNPIESGAIPLAIGDDRNMILLEGPAREDGELEVVKYYLTQAEQRYPDLVALFEATAERLRR